MKPGEQCKKRVFAGMRSDWGGHQCSRKAGPSGFCGMHTPEAEERRKKKWDDEYRAERAREERRYAIEKAKGDVVTAAMAWHPDEHATERATLVAACAALRKLREEGR